MVLARKITAFGYRSKLVDAVADGIYSFCIKCWADKQSVLWRRSELSSGEVKD